MADLVVTPLAAQPMAAPPPPALTRTQALAKAQTYNAILVKIDEWLDKAEQFSCVTLSAGGSSHPFSLETHEQKMAFKNAMLVMRDQHNAKTMEYLGSAAEADKP